MKVAVQFKHPRMVSPIATLWEDEHSETAEVVFFASSEFSGGVVGGRFDSADEAKAWLASGGWVS